MILVEIIQRLEAIAHGPDNQVINAKEKTACCQAARLLGGSIKVWEHQPKRDFVWAVQQMKDGKRVRQTDWAPYWFWCTEDTIIVNNFGKECALTLADINAEWELFVDSDSNKE